MMSCREQQQPEWVVAGSNGSGTAAVTKITVALR